MPISKVFFKKDKFIKLFFPFVVLGFINLCPFIAFAFNKWIGSDLGNFLFFFLNIFSRMKVSLETVELGRQRRHYL